MILVLCGLPGSGKTTLSQKLSQQYNAQICCYDNFKKQNCRRKISDFYYFVQQKAIKSNVVVDITNLELKSRLHLLELLKKNPKQKILVVLTTSPDECVKRSLKRGERIISKQEIHLLNSIYQKPSLEEGWDDIWYV